MVVSETKKIDIQYTPSNQFRNIHVDGVYGGFGPGLTLKMSVFAERRHFPTAASREVLDGVAVGDEVFNTPEGILREIEAVLHINYDTAIIIRDWLSNHIEQMASLISLKPTEDKE